MDLCSGGWANSCHEQLRASQPQEAWRHLRQRPWIMCVWSREVGCSSKPVKQERLRWRKEQPGDDDDDANVAHLGAIRPGRGVGSRDRGDGRELVQRFLALHSPPHHHRLRKQLAHMTTHHHHHHMITVSEELVPHGVMETVELHIWLNEDVACSYLTCCGVCTGIGCDVRVVAGHGVCE
jgi:hypothetical protein